ncbi:hypothetical protein [Stigmatella aurantiaca]|uniref:Uncharacterized protein n=1 Tax=Stigmatella aurantiaca (strain DW4/3-1) TaxID=378806 RepID=E3FZI9_STIAD|nr:hypothetical protein [Stigmatella aurantiaca]ADO68654.1 uncharacterized protein STAUR_0850 [Stigmatella aurantiaca DW4/3-1]
MIRRLLGACAVVVVVTAWACGGSESVPPPPNNVNEEPTNPGAPDSPDSGTPGTPDSGTPGNPDSGTPGNPDSGTPGNPDSGTPEPPPPPQGGPGPWPTDPQVNYTQRYNLGRVLSVSVDDAQNIWLLNGTSIGVLRPGDTQPRWVSHIGQASQGFSPDTLATGSTVICGGSAGRAYVGYTAEDVPGGAFIYSPDGRSHPRYDDPDPSRFDPVRYGEYQKGDMDVVRVTADGSIVLEEHLQKSATPNGPQNIGIRNTNDHHFDEDRSVLTCTKVTRGAERGDIYIGTNHGVTRIKGLQYNSHRHPVWFEDKLDENGNVVGQTQRAGYTYALGISQSGDVLIGNDWNVAVVTPTPNLVDWDRTEQSITPEKLNSYVRAVNSLAEKDYWRGFQQTKDGSYYLASRDFGLWKMTILRRSEENSVKVAGLPTDSLTSLAATDDGSLFIGTKTDGLWRLDGQKQLTKVAGVAGSQVRELFYDPSVTPASLYVLTNDGLTVIRGH